MLTNRVAAASVAGVLALALSGGAWAAFGGQRPATGQASQKSHPGQAGTVRGQAPRPSGATAAPGTRHETVATARKSLIGPRQTATYVVGRMSLMVSSPPGRLAASARAVTPSFAAEIQAMAAGNHALGVHVVGAPRVLWTRALRSHHEPGTRAVEMCLDTSKVHILDASGHRAQQQRSVTRTRQIYTLARVDGHWLVAGQSFPDDPSC